MFFKLILYMLPLLNLTLTTENSSPPVNLRLSLLTPSSSRNFKVSEFMFDIKIFSKSSIICLTVLMLDDDSKIFLP